MRARAIFEGTRLRVLLCALIALACEDDDASIYSARPYRAELDCVEGYLPLALVYAKDLPARCDPACLRLGERLYVSIVCPPLPESAQLESSDESAECARALSALAEERTCEAAPEASEEMAPAGDAGALLDAG